MIQKKLGFKVRNKNKYYFRGSGLKMTNSEIILKLIKDVTGVELELEEEFTLAYGVFKITQDGLYSVSMNRISTSSLQEFIEALPTIKTKPKFPQKGSLYYYIAPLDEPCPVENIFNNSWDDKLRYKIGNFFLTYE